MSTETRIAELERELKAARRRVDDMRADHDQAVRAYEQRIEELKESHEARVDTISAMVEQVQECDAQIERWIEAFNMVRNDKGVWMWGDDLIEDRNKWFNEYRRIRDEWNRFVPEYNAVVAPSARLASLRNIGRPLAAGPGQVERIKARRKEGKSLRWIAEEMGLGLQTVRTVLDKADGVDRATLARLERIAPDKIAEARSRRAIRDIAALPKRINANLKRNAELIKQAKGLK
jgi:DNA repair exonuclease SbcCD ATPase subunit